MKKETVKTIVAQLFLFLLFYAAVTAGAFLAAEKGKASIFGDSIPIPFQSFILCFGTVIFLFLLLRFIRWIEE
jgi:uncharacterized protein HemY